ncbi:hypothetical protein ACLOJK_000195 [Asimina triloba]
MKSMASNPSPDIASTSPARARLRPPPLALASAAAPRRNRLHRPSAIISPRLPAMVDANVGNTLACRQGRGTTPSTHGDGPHPYIEDSPATMLLNVAYK